MTRLRTWIAHWQIVPNPWVDTPIRPYAAAPSAAANSRASRRISSAGMPLAASAASGVNSATALGGGVQPVDVRRRRGQPLVEQHVQHGQQHVGVGAGPDEVVLGGDLGGLGAARVEHHHPAAARLQLAQPVREVGHRPQRAVGRHRVGAEHQQVGRAVDVGDRQEQLVAVHQVRHQLVGELVDRGRAVAVAGAEASGPSPARGSSSRGCARWGCRGRRPAASRPCRLIALARPSATRSRASSQPISTHSSPTRRTGRRRRSGSV